jgi:uncharacterized membrane protein YfcA
VLLLAAGFIDAIVGGGLIQTPAGLILLPNLPVSTVRHLKIPAFSGTSFAAYQYQKVTMDWKLLLIMVLRCLPLLSGLTYYLYESIMKPLLLFFFH